MKVDVLMANLKNAVYLLDACRENVEKSPKLFTSPADHKFIEVHNLCVDIRVALDKLNHAKSRSFAALKHAEYMKKNGR